MAQWESKERNGQGQGVALVVVSLSPFEWAKKWAIKKALWWAAEKISDLGLQRWAKNDITNRGKTPLKMPQNYSIFILPKHNEQNPRHKNSREALIYKG